MPIPKSRLWTLLPMLALSPLSSALISRNPQSPPLRAIFSDIDGTLVHYAKDFQKHGVRLVSSNEQTLTAIVEGPNGDRRNCRLLPSLTMGPACVSERTIELVEELRAHGVLFCVVTAARKSTMLQRWDLLPACDAHVCEAGSRIWVDGRPDAEFADRFVDVCGPIDRELEGADSRPEPLWQFYRRLREELPDVGLDSRSYYGMFRVSTKDDAFIEDALHDKIETSLPTGVSWSTNLGKYDFYPSAAGKGNAVNYLQNMFGIKQSETACLFDDDNDLPMAEQCGIHMLPGLTSDSVKAAAAQQPSWQIAKTVGQGVFAIEECLETLLERAKIEKRQRQEEEAKSNDIEELLREVEEVT
eukprot:CAMPEP_0172314028 /NCGR_PEP_ID=MMETSP1058-20130122/21483_1 /TAXON_ID=83371 /ORGANISM="Detonula confervacea, Strain CCMP 353" /LENGTH=357 /DNA_ID=CAMNT_0013027781 /DNA_START=75 /DNA_END=1145 /DNA_ORIENTATION=+